MREGRKRMSQEAILFKQVMRGGRTDAARRGRERLREAVVRAAGLKKLRKEVPKRHSRRSQKKS